MALASSCVKMIKRTKGQSAVAVAASRSGTKIYDEKTGQFHNHSKKTGIVHTEILAPQQAPKWVKNRSQLWNMVEAAEHRYDAQVARQIMIALQRELTIEQNIELAREYAQIFVIEGMVVDMSVRDDGDGNPHAYFLLTTRFITEDGFGKKNKEWNGRAKIIEWRRAYQDITNKHLEKHGHEERIDVMSYEKRGIDKIPTIHLGHSAHNMEKRKTPSKRGDINRSINEQNQKTHDPSYH